VGGDVVCSKQIVKSMRAREGKRQRTKNVEKQLAIALLKFGRSKVG
jgi:hypothetical protein